MIRIIGVDPGLAGTGLGIIKGTGLQIKGYSFGVGVTYMDYLKIDIGYMTQKGTWPEAGYFDSTTTVSTEFKNNIVGVSIGFLFGRKAD